VIVRDLIDRLAEHRTLGAAPRAELEWLSANGYVQRRNPGEVLGTKDSPVEALQVVLSGRLALFLDRGSGPSKAAEWHAGDVTGLLPYSRLVSPPGDVIVLEPSEFLSIPRGRMREMTRECSEITSILVHVMLDRTRLFTSSDLQNEKMLSLGKLSAGLAHELNNPVAAMERAVAMLEDCLKATEQASRCLAMARLSDAQIAAVDAFHRCCIVPHERQVRSSLEQGDREEEMEAWLDRHGLDTESAHLLADTDVALSALDRLASALEGPILNTVVRWAAAACAMRSLTAMIQDSAIRISGLVYAVKGFTHMGQANAAEPVDVATSLANTVTVLNWKAREKSVNVTLELEPELPKVQGFAAELGQVWGSLIDNALDAVDHEGHVEVLATRENGTVVVRVRDDGPGIPAEVRSRIFDPFFTTKPLGQGTGLGLDIARRLARHNDGMIDFETRPGRTEFRVRLPIAESQPVALR
jgi:signal transduction histidine kinase